MGTENFDHGKDSGGSGEASAAPAGPRRFTTKRAEELIFIDDQEYKLVELTGAERDAYQDVQLERIKMKDGKAVGVTSTKDLQALLVQKCLRKIDGTEVLVATVKQWPASLLEDLSVTCSEMNRLTKKSQDDAKNS